MAASGVSNSYSLLLVPSKMSLVSYTIMLKQVIHSFFVIFTPYAELNSIETADELAMWHRRLKRNQKSVFNLFILFPL